MGIKGIKLLKKQLSQRRLWQLILCVHELFPLHAYEHGNRAFILFIPTWSTLSHE